MKRRALVVRPQYDHDVDPIYPFCRRCGANAFMAALQNKSCVAPDSNVTGLSHIVAARREKRRQQRS